MCPGVITISIFITIFSRDFVITISIVTACSVALDYLNRVGILIIYDANCADLKICQVFRKNCYDGIFQWLLLTFRLYMQWA